LCPGGSLCAYEPGQKTIRGIVFPAIGKADRQREQQTTGRGTFVPLHFDPGDAFQFDWSEDFAVPGGGRAKLQMAHIKLSAQSGLFAARLSAADP
jgi:hypothetical protein